MHSISPQRHSGKPVHIECSRGVGRFCYLILWPEIILGMLPVSNLSYATITCVHARTQLYSGVAVSRLHKEYVHVPECGQWEKGLYLQKALPSLSISLWEEWLSMQHTVNLRSLNSIERFTSQPFNAYMYKTCTYIGSNVHHLYYWIISNYHLKAIVCSFRYLRYRHE